MVFDCTRFGPSHFPLLFTIYSFYDNKHTVTIGILDDLTAFGYVELNSVNFLYAAGVYSKEMYVGFGILLAQQINTEL